MKNKAIQIISRCLQDALARLNGRGRRKKLHSVLICRTLWVLNSKTRCCLGTENSVWLCHGCSPGGGSAVNMSKAFKTPARIGCINWKSPFLPSSLSDSLTFGNKLASIYSSVQFIVNLVFSTSGLIFSKLCFRSIWGVKFNLAGS